MSNWGDDTDFEVKQLKDYKARFTINFKKIYMDVDEINEKTLEVNEKHPKDSLIKLWAGTMVGIFIFLLLSYQVFALVMVPFLVFYIIALFRIFKCWKGFKYKAAPFWLISIITIAVMIVLSHFAQELVIRLMS